MESVLCSTEHPIDALSVSDSGRFLAVATSCLEGNEMGGELLVKEVLTADAVRLVDCGSVMLPAGAASVAWAGENVLLGLDNGDIELMRLGGPVLTPSTRMLEHDDAVTCIRGDPHGPRAASSSSDCTVKVWDLETGNSMLTVESHFAPVTFVQWLGGGLLASASKDRHLRLLDPRAKGAITQAWLMDAIPTAGAWSQASEACLALGFDNGFFGQLDLRTGSLLERVSAEGRQRGSVNAVAMAGQAVTVTGGDDCVVRIFPGLAGAAVLKPGHTDYVQDVALILSDSIAKFCISGSWDKTLRCWAI